MVIAHRRERYKLWWAAGRIRMLIPQQAAAGKAVVTRSKLHLIGTTHGKLNLQREEDQSAGSYKRKLLAFFGGKEKFLAK